MFADKKRVARRRLMRRLKAAASIAVALAAGTFLACRRDEQPTTGDVADPQPSADDAPKASAPPPDPGDTASSAAPGASASPSASSKALAVPSPAPPPPTAKPTVDKQQHKKGMPVPDNLLE